MNIFEEEQDIAVLGYVEFFNVPDSTQQQSIPVTIKGVFGESEAFRFDRINWSRTDSLILVAVWGRQIYKTGVSYPVRHVGFDTTITVTSTRRGFHFVDIRAAQGTLRDSTTVY